MKQAVLLVAICRMVCFAAVDIKDELLIECVIQLNGTDNSGSAISGSLQDPEMSNSSSRGESNCVVSTLDSTQPQYSRRSDLNQQVTNDDILHDYSKQIIHIIQEIPVPYPVTVERKVHYPVPIPVDQPVAVHVSQPYPVRVEKKVPVPVAVPFAQPFPVHKIIHVPVEVPVNNPVPYIAYRPVPFYLQKNIPFPVIKHVQMQMDVPIGVKKEVPIPVTVDKKVPLYIPKPVPYEVKIPIEKPFKAEIGVPYPITVENPRAGNQQAQFTIMQMLNGAKFMIQKTLPVPNKTSIAQGMG